jgi:hypothetical protein
MRLLLVAFDLSACPPRSPGFAASDRAHATWTLGFWADAPDWIADRQSKPAFDHLEIMSRQAQRLALRALHGLDPRFRRSENTRSLIRAAAPIGLLPERTEIGLPSVAFDSPPGDDDALFIAPGAPGRAFRDAFLFAFGGLLGGPAGEAFSPEELGLVAMSGQNHQDVDSRRRWLSRWATCRMDSLPPACGLASLASRVEAARIGEAAGLRSGGAPGSAKQPARL